MVIAVICAIIELISSWAANRLEGNLLDKFQAKQQMPPHDTLITLEHLFNGNNSFHAFTITMALLAIAAK
jgi:hypothetical protein